MNGESCFESRSRSTFHNEICYHPAVVVCVRIIQTNLITKMSILFYIFKSPNLLGTSQTNGCNKFQTAINTDDISGNLKAALTSVLSIRTGLTAAWARIDMTSWVLNGNWIQPVFGGFCRSETKFLVGKRTKGEGEAARGNDLIDSIRIHKTKDSLKKKKLCKSPIYGKPSTFGTTVNSN